MNDATHEVFECLRARAATIKNEEDLKLFRDLCLGRKNGILTQFNDLWLKAVPAEQKKQVGLHINGEVRPAIDVIVKNATQSLSIKVKLREILGSATDRLDITLPGIRRPIGSEHPVLRTMNDVISVFRAMGYSVAEGPEVETDFYNFEALNFPPNHPARDTQDTLTIADQESKPLRERLLLRTHTSPVQIRTMEQQKPPVRIICPGKVHRRDTPDASHSPVFHQVEGLAVDTNITFSDLKGTLDHAMKALFGSAVKTRFFPSFFPFTEPSADVAISCIICGGKGCRTCKQTGWVELMGCGMVDPSVFDFVKDNGYDSTKISGFAFGMGVERLAMMKYGIDDIQLLFQGDVRFLSETGY